MELGCISSESSNGLDDKRMILGQPTSNYGANSSSGEQTVFYFYLRENTAVALYILSFRTGLTGMQLNYIYNKN